MASLWQNKPDMSGNHDDKNAPENIISSDSFCTATTTKIEQADALISQNELTKAYGIYKEILGEDARHAGALFGIGLILEKQQKFDLAIQFLSKAFESNPDKTQALLTRGRIFRLQGLFENAISDFTKIILQHPDDFKALIARGITFGHTCQFNAAINDFSVAISINPNCAEAFYNRGVVYENLHKFESAVEDYSIAIKLNPYDFKAYNNRGVARRETKCFGAALKDFDKCVEISPDFAEGHYNKSLTLLSLGNLKEGFKLYEYRWKTANFQSKVRHFSQPLWLGDGDLAGKTILVHSEQGLGDSIQYCRYLSFFNKIGCKVLLEIEDSLHSLMHTFLPKAQIYSKGGKLDEFDYHCPLMSLPLALDKIVTSIPWQTPYITISDETKSKWAEKLGTKTKPRIGICWRGNKEHPKDWRRSINIQDVINNLPRTADLICLQNDVSDAEKRLFENTNLICLNEHIGDFASTAGLCKNLDAVVTVDTSIGHLAGAIGVPTQLVLSNPCDFRWLTNGVSTPWYNTHCLHRANQEIKLPELFLRTVEVVCNDLSPSNTYPPSK
jgi:tetratricopeptide (TPR) repeat protein